jgi:arylsulfatase A-like enzyme
MYNRREFLKYTALGVSVLNALPLRFTFGGTLPSTPNVVFVFADQFRAQSLGYADCSDIDTPRFDQFAAESVNYSNAVSTFPVCTPYRASLVTGRYPLTTGAILNDLQLNTDATSIAQAYSAAGYTTGYIGKWHLDGNGRSNYIPPDRRQGFDYWKVLECTHDYNNSKYYAGNNPTKLTWSGYDVYAQTNDAIQYLDARAADHNPFSLFLAWGPPHFPLRTGPTVLLSKYDAKTLTQRDNVPAGTNQSDLAGYYAHIEALDIAFGQLLDALAANGLDQNTIVVFTSDHGDMLHSQGQTNKQLPWDESILVPFLVRVPGNTPKRIEVPLGTPDIMPTLLGLCNIPIPAGCDGQDLSAEILGNVSPPNDRACLILNPSPFSSKAGFAEWRGVRTKRYTFVRRLSNGQSVPWLLYDNQTDPYQLTNLANNPAYAAVQADLDLQLEDLLCQTGDSFQTRAEIVARCGYTVTSNWSIDYNNPSAWGQVTVPCCDNLGCDPTTPSVDAGIDMITWSGEPVQLDPTVVNNSDPPTDLTYAWSADTPPAGVTVEFDPIDPIAANDPTPTVMITKPLDGIPVTVTLRLAVNNVGRPDPPVTNTLTIDVYDNACEVAKAGGSGEDNPGDFDGNCITDANDLAELAAKWLNGNALTAPVAK